MGAGIRAAVLPFMLATLGACGGGGGGGGGVVVPTEVTFTSFGAVAANQTVVMEGTSVTLSGTNGPSTATSADNGPIGTATVKLRYDGARQLAGISANTPQVSFSFDRNTPGTTVSCNGSGACTAENATGFVVTVDPFVAGWNYQSFGVWGLEPSPTTFKLGAVSAGRPTSGSSLPITGIFNFTGAASGAYIDAGGTLFATGAAMTAEVNFGTRNIGFSTSDTRRSGVLDTGLDLSGTLRYDQGVNSFSGSLQTRNGQLTGQGSGQFYGPAAQEIGGVYSLSAPTGVSRMVGGFGGKR